MGRGGIRMPPHPALSPETAVRERCGESASSAGKFRGRGNLFGAKSLVRTVSTAGFRPPQRGPRFHVVRSISWCAGARREVCREGDGIRGELVKHEHQMVPMQVDVHFGMLRLGGTGSASVRERLVGPGKALEQARPHWQSQCHPARSATSHS